MTVATQPPGISSRRPSSGLDAETPWLGLQAFAESDCEFFFGREAETAELLRLVKREKLTVLFGRSGRGKTSLLRAGLFPTLRQVGFLPVYIRLDHSETAPPLIHQMRQIKEGDFRSANSPRLIPVLVFDQFEELFTLGRENLLRRTRGKEFVVELASLIEESKVLLSLDEDYLSELDDLLPERRGDRDHRFRLRRLNGKQAFEAVVSPGEEIVEEEIALQIVYLVAGLHADGIPDGGELGDVLVDPALLSHTCRALNHQRLAEGQATITGELIAGSRSQILEKFYRDSLAGLPQEVGIFIEDELVTPSGFRNHVALDDQPGENGITPSVIDQLIERGLLRYENFLGIRRLELVHDVLAAAVRASRDTRKQQIAGAKRAAEQAATAAERRKAEVELAIEQRHMRVQRSARRARAITLVATIVAGVALWFCLPANTGTKIEESDRSDDLRLEQAFALRTRGETLIRSGRLSEGMQAHREALALYRAAARTDARYLAELSGARAALANALMLQGKIEEALPLHRVSYEQRQHAVAQSAGGLSEKRLFLSSQLEMGEAMLRTGNLREGLRYFEEAHGLARELVHVNPADVNAQDALSLTLDRLGNARQAAGKLNEALELARQSYEIQLNLRDPDNIARLRTYSLAYARVLEIALIQGGQANLREGLIEVVKNLRSIAASDRTNPKANDDLASALVTMGDFLRSRGDLAGAGQHYEEALTLRSATAALDKTHLDRLEMLAQAHARLGDLALDRGEWETAIERYGRSREIREPLVRADPLSPQRRAQLAAVDEALAEISKQRNDLAAAQIGFERARALRQELAQKDPANVQWQAELGASHRKIAAIRFAQNKPDEGREQIAQSRQILWELYRASPENAYLQEEFVVTARTQAEALLARGTDKSALDLLKLLSKVAAELTSHDPENLVRQIGHARALWLTGNAIHRFEPRSKKEGRKMHEKARNLIRSAAERAELTHEQKRWAGEMQKSSRTRG